MRRQMMAVCAVMGALIGAFIGTGTNGAAQQPAAAADLVVSNAQVLTVDAANSRAQAVAIRDSRFAAVGSNDDIKKWIGPQTRVIDAGGRTVVPGLIESHVHATGAARGEAVREFVQLHSIGDMQDWIRARTKEVPAGTWIQLPRVDVTRIREGRIPTRADLDAASTTHPVVYTWEYGSLTQTQVLNSLGVKIAKITKDTRIPGGRVELAPNGEPTGLVDNGRSYLDKVIPDRTPTRAEYLDSLARLMRRYNEVGITSISERSSGPEGYRDYQQLRAENRLPVRVTLTTRINPNGTVEDAERVMRALPYKFGDGDDWLKPGPLKIGVDGGTMHGTLVRARAVSRNVVPALSQHRSELSRQLPSGHHRRRDQEYDSHRASARMADVHARHRRRRRRCRARRRRGRARRQPHHRAPLHAHPRLLPQPRHGGTRRAARRRR